MGKKSVTLPALEVEEDMGLNVVLRCGKVVEAKLVKVFQSILPQAARRRIRAMGLVPVAWCDVDEDSQTGIKEVDVLFLPKRVSPDGRVRLRSISRNGSHIEMTWPSDKATINPNWYIVAVPAS